jgi:hypothetical protein
MTILNSGNVGIGTTGPALKLDVVASGGIGFAGTAILSDNAGTMTLSNVDAIDATTETTLESALDFLTAEVDGSTTNEINTITLPDANVTAGLGITFAQSGSIAITESAPDTITFTVTEVDGSTTNEIEVVDEVFNATNFNGGTTSAVSQDDFYDLWHGIDTDDDGDIDVIDTTVWATKQAANTVLAELTALTDPSADRLVFWNDTSNNFEFLDYSAWDVTAYTASFVITNPTSSADSPVWRAPEAITITAVHVLCVGGTNIVGQLWEYDGNGANGAVVDDSDITGTAGSNVNDDGTLSNPSIDSGDYVGWVTTSVSGTPTKAIITYDYTRS